MTQLRTLQAKAGLNHADASGGPVVSLYTYLPLPFDGHGPARSCVTILDNMPPNRIAPVLFTPRTKAETPGHVTVRQTLPTLLRRSPYLAARRIGGWSSKRAFAQALDSMDPKTSIAWFWPNRARSLILEAKARGILTVREMTNCTCLVAKRIYDDAYRAINAPPTHGISDEGVRLEEEELPLYDYVFTPKQAEPGVLASGVDPDRIVPSSFGWDPRRFASVGERTPGSGPVTALFVGSVCIGKGCPHLLKAWKQSRIDGRLILVGKIASEMKPFLGPYLNDPSISFIGFTKHLAELYRDASFFVFPTFAEGGPQVNFEAAGLGLPIITTPMGAGRLIKDGVNGLVVPAGDVDALAGAMAKLAGSPKLCLAFGQAAKSAARNFTYQNIGSYRARAFQALLRRDPAPPRLEMAQLDAWAE